MKQAHNAIHTFLYDERTDFTALSNARCWSLAMITNRCWYQVDWHAQNAPDNSASGTFICVDFETLLTLLPTEKTGLDVQIHLHHRSPKTQSGGCSVETISRIIKLNDGSHMLVMASGQLRFVGGKHGGTSDCVAGETVFSVN